MATAGVSRCFKTHFMQVKDINGVQIEVSNVPVTKQQVEALIELLNSEEIYPIAQAEEKMYWQDMLVKLIVLENKKHN